MLQRTEFTPSSLAWQLKLKRGGWVLNDIFHLFHHKQQNIPQFQRTGMHPSVKREAPLLFYNPIFFWLYFFPPPYSVL